MSSTRNPYFSYRQSQVETADPGELLLLLYGGAVSFLRRGREAMARDNVEEANRFLGRAQDILCELMSSLNPELPEIAGGLFLLYEYIHYLLVQGNVRKETVPLDEAEKLLLMLQETWQQALSATVPKAARG